jgi:hypothetical protein
MRTRAHTQIALGAAEPFVRVVSVEYLRAHDALFVTADVFSFTLPDDGRSPLTPAFLLWESARGRYAASDRSILVDRNG